jgi:5-methylcytosine-specific restriction endonuclease McrA
MTYADQLNSFDWKTKRERIVIRDRKTCAHCDNKSFDISFRKGLIISNSVDHKGAKSSKNLNNDFVLAHIHDMENDSRQIGFLECYKFSTSKSYICYYIPGPKYPQIVALKEFENDDIELTNDIMTIIELGIKGTVTPETYEKIYRESTQSDNWEIVNKLHVHHKYYQLGLLAWEYPDEALITLCWDCHEQLHKNQHIPVLNADGMEISKLTYCDRCFGAGYFPEYHHVQAGICFKCAGAKYVELAQPAANTR